MYRKILKSKLLRFAGSALLGLTVITIVPEAKAEISFGKPTAPAAATAPRAAGSATFQLAQWGWGPPPRSGWDRYPPRYRRYPPRYYDRRYAPPPRYRRSRSHVNWCLNRYRSYNPRTDQFLGYDGYYHYCRSPYR